jgi:hypothetical protein
MRRTRKDWWHTVAEERQWLVFGMSHGEIPYEARVAALADLERRFLREARTPAEREHLMRLTAEDVLIEAFSHRRPWKDFAPWLRRLKRLGFSDLPTRQRIAAIYVKALPYFPDRARDAFAMLADAERRVLRRRKDRPSRQQMLDSIANARREAASNGILPPDGSSR